MIELAAKVINALENKTLATAESCTGGGIGSVLTAVPGSSAVYKGGIISYTNEIKQSLLSVPEELLDSRGAVSGEVAAAMAKGAKQALGADVAVSVTGLAGPGADTFGNPVGTVFIGYCDDAVCESHRFWFDGDRQQVRQQSVCAALTMIFEKNK